LKRLTGIQMFLIDQRMAEQPRTKTERNPIQLGEAYANANSLIRNLGLMNAGGAFLAITFLGSLSQQDNARIIVDILTVQWSVQWFLAGLVCSLVSAFIVFLALNEDRLRGDTKRIGWLQLGAIFWFTLSLAAFCYASFTSVASFSTAPPGVVSKTSDQTRM
jgi:hypothetical protein